VGTERVHFDEIRTAGDIDEWLYKNAHLKCVTAETRMQVAGFDWDEGNRSKCQKHGVSPAEIEDIFRRPIAVVPDPLHSKSEERFKAIGRTAEGRGILVVFTFRTRRGKRLIRPISARRIHKREMKHYEKETATLQKR
jgi:uncharacterized DUF497 family protein